MVCTFVCLLIAVAPHLGTVFSMMHTYAGLAMIAIIIAFSISQVDHLKPVVVAFVLWIIAAVLIDIHLIDASVKSGLIGKNMAKDAIQKTGSPVDNVYVIIIEDDYPKLSSFCVIPNEAFGWGLAAQYETNYQWPKSIKDTTIVHSENALEEAKQLSRKIVNEGHYGCVWIVNHQSIDVVKR
jgi:sporulation protein YlmC with PRC-barrel domain